MWGFCFWYFLVLVFFVPGLVCRFLCLSLEDNTSPVLRAGADSSPTCAAACRKFPGRQKPSCFLKGLSTEICLERYMVGG